MGQSASTIVSRRGPMMVGGGEGGHWEERYFVHFAAGDDICELPTVCFIIESGEHLCLSVPDASTLIYINETNGSDGIPVASKGTVQLKRTVTTSALDVGVVLKGR